MTNDHDHDHDQLPMVKQVTENSVIQDFCKIDPWPWPLTGDVVGFVCWMWMLHKTHTIFLLNYKSVECLIERTQSKVLEMDEDRCHHWLEPLDNVRQKGDGDRFVPPASYKSYITVVKSK